MVNIYFRFVNRQIPAEPRCPRPGGGGGAAPTGRRGCRTAPWRWPPSAAPRTSAPSPVPPSRRGCWYPRSVGCIALVGNLGCVACGELVVSRKVFFRSQDDVVSLRACPPPPRMLPTRPPRTPRDTPPHRPPPNPAASVRRLRAPLGGGFPHNGPPPAAPPRPPPRPLRRQSTYGLNSSQILALFICIYLCVRTHRGLAATPPPAATNRPPWVHNSSPTTSSCAGIIT